ncbi:unknown [Bacteroides sp. CAG:709]|nr:unknown [Bacteroides sp. CAG:709]
MRETGLFTHGRATLNFTIIPKCTPVSQCQVHAVPRRDVPCPCTNAPSAPPARELLPCPVPNPTAPTLRNPTSHSRHTFHPHHTCFPSLSRRTFHHSPAALALPLSFPHRLSPILATFPSSTCVLKRFPLTLPRKLSLTCVKRPVLRTAESTSLGRL